MGEIFSLYINYKADSEDILQSQSDGWGLTTPHASGDPSHIICHCNSPLPLATPNFSPTTINKYNKSFPKKTNIQKKFMIYDHTTYLTHCTTK